MEQYIFSDKLKKTTFALMGIGVLSLALGIFGLEGDKVWANIYINSFFFFAIALIATFFIAVQYAAESAYTTVYKRVMEAISQYYVVGAITLLVVLAAASLHLNHLFHWMDPAVMDPDSEHFDELIYGKKGYLNQPFFWIRTLVYLGVWYLFTRWFRKTSIEQDMIGGTDLHFKSQRNAAIFLVFFGFTSSTASWDWIMSIDTHWFSTLFGWYVFSGMWCSGMIAVLLLTIYLKSEGYLKEVNDSHIHDMTKWVFATSFLWSYMFFSQFMLIWYSNIPEEVTYFLVRIEDYKILYWGMFAVNFALPMILLMDRDSKRNKKLAAFVSIIIFFGHWTDVYMMVIPGVLKGGGASIGLFEIGLFLGFLGLFIFVVMNSLTKAPLVIKQHPYLEESLHHEIH